MPDPISSQPTENPTSAPQSAPVPGAAGSPPAAPTASSDQPVIPLTPDAPYSYRDPETGQVIETTLGQATEAQRELTKLQSQLGENFDPEKYATWQKATAGDPEALRSLVEMGIPKPEAQPNPDDPYEQRFSSMETTLKAIQEQLSNVVPIADGIRNEMTINQIGTAIKEKANDFPLAASFPSAAVEVQKEIAEIELKARPAAENQGIDWDKWKAVPANAQKLLQTAMTQFENRLKQYQQHLSGQPAPAPTQNGQTVVNDQTVVRRADQVRDHGANMVFDPTQNRYVPVSSLQEQVPVNGHPVPPNPVQPAVGGVPGVQQPRTGPMTEAEFRQTTRERLQQVRSGV